MKWEISNKQNKTRLVVITALVAFGTVFLLTGALMTQVYGLPSTYNETLQITKNATTFTEGQMINNYIDSVKQDICKTLVNAAEYEECLKL